MTKQKKTLCIRQILEVFTLKEHIGLKYMVTHDLNTIEKCILDSKHIRDLLPHTHKYELFVDAAKCHILSALPR